MTERNDGGAAFPISHYGEADGMSLRDWLAGQAMSGLLLGRPLPTRVNNQEAAARLAYQLADAMLEERSK